MPRTPAPPRLRTARSRSRCVFFSSGPNCERSAAEAGSRADTSACSAPGTVISNGTVSLGVNCLGHLNYDRVGLQFDATGNDSTFAGCECEGWGLADARTRVTGFANDSAGISDNLVAESFVFDEDSATATVIIEDLEGEPMFRVTHDYQPSPATPNAYAVDVVIDNVSGARTDLLYRRVMDWDIEPTAFSEFVTIETGSAEEVVYTSDDGFASADPLSGRTEINFSGEAVDDGPDDHGTLFDFAFGFLDAGETRTFNTFYGAAGDEPGALAALSAVGAEAYSLGQPNTDEGGGDDQVPETHWEDGPGASD